MASQWPPSTKRSDAAPRCTGSSVSRPRPLHTTTRRARTWLTRAAAVADRTSARRARARYNAQRFGHAASLYLRAHAVEPELGRFDQLDPAGAADIDQLGDQLLRHRQRR